MATRDRHVRDDRPTTDETSLGPVAFAAFIDGGEEGVEASEVTKETDKVYRRHSGYLGGLKSVAAGDLRAKQPTRVVEEAIRGMLPKSKLGDAMFRKVKVYAGDSHPHQAQQPTPFEVA